MTNLIEAPATVATVAPTTQSITVGLEIALPTLVILGFIAFLVTGFRAGLGQAQPLPVYILFNIDTSTPFQVGALTIVALLAFGIYALIANTRRGTTTSPAAGAGA